MYDYSRYCFYNMVFNVDSAKKAMDGDQRALMHSFSWGSTKERADYWCEKHGREIDVEGVVRLWFMIKRWEEVNHV